MNDFICMFLVIGVTMYLYRLKDKLREKNDESMITMDDYTVKVYGLPQDVTEDRVRAHFGRFGEFHEIVFGRDLKELIDLRRKMLRLSPDKTKERAEVLAKINTAYSEEHEVSCFVVYAEEEGRFACSGAVSKSVVAQFANKTKDSELAADDVRLFEGKHVLEITSADPPSDILWENLHYSRKNMPLRRAIMNILMAIFLVVQFGIIAHARDTSDQSLNPVAGVLGDRHWRPISLDCTASLDLTSQTLHALGKEDHPPFIKRDVNRKSATSSP